jgi:hypothetical protein
MDGNPFRGEESIQQRCWDEAMSVRDMLAPAPPRKTPLELARERFVAAVAVLHRHDWRGVFRVRQRQRPT